MTNIQATRLPSTTRFAPKRPASRPSSSAPKIATTCTVRIAMKSTSVSKPSSSLP